MLAFMRKHQKYFFVVITFVIVISFSFFGTYSTLAGNSIHEQVAFTTVTGDPINRSDLEDMSLFIGTDREDKKLFGGMWGPNFLNDGVIRKDFFETGLAEILMETYGSDLQVDLKNRLAKELRFRPYVHPQASFLSSLNAWNYFAPDLLVNLTDLQKAKDPLTSEAIHARVQLFLAEKRFPAPLLKQVLKYQESQNRWVEGDPNLDYSDLSLFGYHTVDDWFGSRFVHLISEFIFNAASLAEQKGYRVTKEEALADLLRNSEISFKENKNNPRIAVGNSTEYFDQQLLRMRLDKPKATKIWQKVLLFRRLFDDIGSAPFVDVGTYENFNAYANEGIKGDLYQLPEALRFSDFNTLQKFETYLGLVSKRSKEEKNTLLLPKEFLSVAEISKKNPELVQKRYLLEIASVSKRSLQAKVSVKETLAWEMEEKNWKRIKEKFPQLALKGGLTEEQRLHAIEGLDERTRMQLDQFVREEIVALHPEWMGEALADAPLRPTNVTLALKGQSAVFEGLDKGEALIGKLDKVELNSELKEVTFDKEHYYRIRVLEKAKDPEIVTFKDAKNGPLLDALADQALEIAYVQLRSEDPAAYQNEDKSWKPLEQVKDKVALSYFKKTLDGIRAALRERKDKEKYKNLEGERLSPYRFVTWANELRQKVEAGKGDPWIASEEKNEFQDQFKWKKSSLQLSRKSEETPAEGDKLLALKPQTWSEAVIAPNGEIYFAYVADKLRPDQPDEFLQEQVLRARYLLGNDAKRMYLYSLLPLLKEKRALSFDYLYAQETAMEEES